MAFHKHDFFSFSVKVQRMKVNGGANFVADVVALRHHGPSGAAAEMEIPVIEEQYGETAPQAEALAVAAMHAWLSQNAALPKKVPAAEVPVRDQQRGTTEETPAPHGAVFL